MMNEGTNQHIKHHAMAMPRSPLAPVLFVSILVFTAHGSGSSNPRQEAVVAFQNLVKEGLALMVESERGVAECKDDECKSCLTELDGNLKQYMASISRHTPEQSDAKVGEARDTLTAILSFPSTSGIACSGQMATTYPIVNKIYKFEDNLQATLNLMNTAQPAPPPPPSEAQEEEEDAKLE